MPFCLKDWVNVCVSTSTPLNASKKSEHNVLLHEQDEKLEGCVWCQRQQPEEQLQLVALGINWMLISLEL